MISEVSIFNYKSILEQRFSLGRVNVFIGQSGSGKTNILEAIGMAAAAHDEALDADSLLKRGIRATEPLLTFHSSAQHKKDEIEIAWQEKNSWKKAKLICVDNALWKDISWYEPEYVEKINNIIKFIGDGTIEGKYPFDDESKNNTLNAAFRGSRNFRDYVIYNNYAGDLLSIFTDKNTPPIFAIDDIETLVESELFKQELMQTVIRLSAKQHKQVFVTTCNTSIVNGLNLKDTEQKLFSVKLTENGQTIVEKMTDKTLIDT